MSPVTDGLITTEEFAKAHPEELDRLVALWFETIRYVGENVEDNSLEIRDYLRTSASTTYSPREYAIAWSFELFPPTAEEAHELFNDPDSRYYWKRSWDEVGRFIVDHKLANRTPPYTAYGGETVLPRLVRSR